MQEVEKRYKILAEHQVENIIEFKKKFPDFSHSMPYILVVVDEFADIVDSQDWKTREDIVMLIKRL